jgi:hypothetical protein
MSFPFRTDLLAENKIVGAQQALRNERLKGKSVLEEYIRAVAFTTGRSQRLLCIGLYVKSFKRPASGTVW